MTKEQLVRGLRYCSAVGMCDDCALSIIKKEFGDPFCDDRLKSDAADLIEAQAAEIEKLKARVPRWIPVEERLPETAGSYIVCTKSGSVVKVNFYPELGRFQRIFTHWMPLPGVEVLA